MPPSKPSKIDYLMKNYWVTFVIHFLNSVLCVHLYVLTCTCCGSLVEVRGQCSSFALLLPHCGVQVLSSGRRPSYKHLDELSHLLNNFSTRLYSTLILKWYVMCLYFDHITYNYCLVLFSGQFKLKQNFCEGSEILSKFLKCLYYYLCIYFIEKIINSDFFMVSLLTTPPRISLPPNSLTFLFDATCTILSR